ncbi:MAG: phosphoenolpyruvate synthase [Eubacterium sp.]|nr:phosphoenolpyruvate synthase [Eubacterium sp.]
MTEAYRDINEPDLNHLPADRAAGHNIVWTLSGLPDFVQIMPYYIREAKKAGKEIVHISFSGEASPYGKDVETAHIPLSHRFEAFTIAVCRLLADHGQETFYIFDCLSELQTAWATDLMMQNFFTVVTPLVAAGNCCAFFPLVRSRHAGETIVQITEAADSLMEVFPDFKDLYVRVRKYGGVDGREELPFVYRDREGFLPVSDGLESARFRKAMNYAGRNAREQSMDSWDRFFRQVQRDYEAGEDVSSACARIRDIMMSRDPEIKKLLRRHFKPEDYFFVKEHMVGTGLIGGKSCGMLTARKIVENLRPDIYDRMEPHNSFFVGSDVFYTYIVENGFWDLRVRQREPEGYFSLADEFADKLMHGTFSAKIEQEFIRLLEYYGPSPVIVRSSSILEDGFGNAFAGKYESVFCPGNGSLAERLTEFENAIRVVYASTLSRSALDYRLRRGLDNRDEQMALLVMRVSGMRFGRYYMPCVAGVGYSYSTYRFLDSLDPKAGMLRMVMGLGTCAVDRIEGSYPRLISLDKPGATAFHTAAEHHRFSQRNVEMIDRETGALEQVPFTVVEKALPAYLKKMLFDRDREAERRLSDRGIFRSVPFVTCSGFADNPYVMQDMQGLMKVVEKEYGQPVDIEFTINMEEDGSYVINLLQCRPLLVFEDRTRQMIPEDLSNREIFLDCRHTSMGQSQHLKLDGIVYVDPVAYYEMPYQRKKEVAAAIGKINWYFRDQHKKMILMVPGRIGTTSPELGVPTNFSDISGFSAIFEIAESGVGYNPELSYGSHIFQDLVENEILYAAVFEDERTVCFRPDRVKALDNRLADIEEELAGLEEIIGYYPVEKAGCFLYHDLFEERLVCTIRKEGM